MSDFEDRIRASKRVNITHGDVVLHCMLPDGLTWALAQGDARTRFDMLMDCVRDWTGVTVGMLLPGAPDAADTAEFSRAALEAYVGDRPSVWMPLLEGIRTPIEQRAKAAEESQKN